MDAYLALATAQVCWHEVRREGAFVLCRRGTGETGWWHDHGDGDYGAHPLDNRDDWLQCRTCKQYKPRAGVLCLDGYAGFSEQPVNVVGMTALKYRIKAPDRKSVKLAGRDRWIVEQETALVPKHAVRL